MITFRNFKQKKMVWMLEVNIMKNKRVMKFYL